METVKNPSLYELKQKLESFQRLLTKLETAIKPDLVQGYRSRIIVEMTRFLSTEGIKDQQKESIQLIINQLNAHAIENMEDLQNEYIKTCEDYLRDLQKSFAEPVPVFDLDNFSDSKSFQSNISLEEVKPSIQDTNISIDEPIDTEESNIQQQNQQNLDDFKQVVENNIKIREDFLSYQQKQPERISEQCNSIMNQKLLEESIGGREGKIEIVQGKDIILILGLEASGQNLFTQFLAVKKDDENKKNSDCKPTPEFPYKTEHVSCHNTYDPKIVCVEMPALTQSTGNAVEISNQLILKQIIGECIKVMIILVINCQILFDQEKCESFVIEMHKLLKDLIQDIDQSCKFLQVIYTHTPKGVHQEDIIEQLEKLSSTFSKNVPIKLFVDHILEITNTDQARSFKPHKKKFKPQNFLKKIYSRIQQYFPKENLILELIEKQIEKIILLVETRGQIIEEQSKNSNYPQITQLLSDNDKLINITNLEELKTLQKGQKGLVEQKMRNDKDQYLISLKTQLSNNNDRLQIDESVELNSMLVQLQLWDQSKTLHFNNSNISKQEFITCVKVQLKEQLIKGIQLKTMDFKRKVVMLTKLQQVFLVCPESFQAEFVEGLHFLEKHPNLYKEDTKNLINDLFSLQLPEELDSIKQKLNGSLSILVDRMETLCCDEIVAKQWLPKLQYFEEAKIYLKEKSIEIQKSSTNQLQKIEENKNEQSLSIISKQFLLLQILSSNQKSLGFASNEIGEVFQRQEQELLTTSKRIADNIKENLQEILQDPTEETQLQLFCDQKFNFQAFSVLRILSKSVEKQTTDSNDELRNEFRKIILKISEKLEQELSYQIKTKEPLTQSFLNNFRALMEIAEWKDQCTSLCLANKEYKKIVGKTNKKFQELSKSAIKEFNPDHPTLDKHLNEVAKKFNFYYNHYYAFESNQLDKDLKQEHDKQFKDLIEKLRQYKGIQISEENVQNRENFVTELEEIIKMYDIIAQKTINKEMKEFFSLKRKDIILKIEDYLNQLIQIIKNSLDKKDLRRAEEKLNELLTFTGNNSINQLFKKQDFDKKSKQLEKRLEELNQREEQQSQFEFRTLYEKNDANGIKAFFEKIDNENSGDLYKKGKEFLIDRLDQELQSGKELAKDQQFKRLFTLIRNLDSYKILKEKELPIQYKYQVKELTSMLVVKILDFLQKCQEIPKDKEISDAIAENLFEIIRITEEEEKIFNSKDQSLILEKSKMVQQKFYDRLMKLLNQFVNKKINLNGMDTVFQKLDRLMPLIKVLQQFKSHCNNNQQPKLIPELNEFQNKIPQLFIDLQNLNQMVNELVPKAKQYLEDMNFKDLATTMKLIKNSKALTKYLKLDEIDYNSLVVHTNKHISEIGIKIAKKIEQNRFDGELKELLSNLEKLEEALKDEKEIFSLIKTQRNIEEQLIDGVLQKFSMSILLKINSFKEKRNEQIINEIGDLLIKMVQMSDSVPSLKQQVDNYVHENVKIILNQLGFKEVVLVSNYLINSKGALGGQLIHDHRVFRAIKDYILNQQIQATHNFQYVFGEMKVREDQNDLLHGLNEKEKQIIESHYTQYDDDSKAILQELILIKERCPLLREKIMTSVKEMNQSKDERQNENFAKQVVKLLAQSFIYWSFTNMGDLSNQDGDWQQAKSYIQQPHASQIISIMLILGLNKEEPLVDYISEQENRISKSNNLLVECLTGQGKSVLLAMSAIIFAFLGFNVDIGCYSKLLSQRDEADFKQIFEHLGVKDKIRYGTITELAGYLMDQQGNVREMSENIVRCNQIDQHNTTDAMRILLLDEFDMFYGPSFYGDTYDAVRYFQTEEITVIINKIWENRLTHKFIALKHLIENLPEYKTLMQQFPDFAQLFAKHIQLMMIHAKDMENHKGKLQKNRKIGYKVGDSTSTDVVEGYKTMFAYIQNFDEGKLNLEDLENKVGINLVSGHFSYTEILKNYAFIKGVSGTLQHLDQSMTNLMKEFISIQYFMPSMYHDQVLDFNQGKNVLIAKDYNNQHLQIKEITQQKLDKKQAVIIFFRNKEQLKKYQDSLHLAPNQENYQQLDEESGNKQDIIQKATRSGQVTLCIREFGRGSNFIPFDKSFNEQGGVVVIQTFFSADKTEEVQIKGRTARQSNNGEYYLVMSAQDLEEDFKIQIQEINNMCNCRDEIYKNLNKIRESQQEEKINLLRSKAKKAKFIHEQTLNLKALMKNNDIQAAKQLLIEIGNNDMERRMPTPEAIHFIFVSDESGSMQEKDGKQITRFQQVQEALDKFLQSRLKQTKGLVKDIVSIIFYSDEARYVLSYQPLQSEIMIKVRAIEPMYKNTYFHKAVDKVMECLQNVASQQHQSLQSVVVFLTDGEDNGEKHLLQESLTRVNTAFKGKIMAWWNLGFGPNENTGALTWMKDHLKDCNAELKQALSPEDLESEFIELANINYQNTQ